MRFTAPGHGERGSWADGEVRDAGSSPPPCREHRPGPALGHPVPLRRGRLRSAERQVGVVQRWEVKEGTKEAPRTGVRPEARRSGQGGVTSGCGPAQPPPGPPSLHQSPAQRSWASPVCLLVHGMKTRGKKSTERKSLKTTLPSRNKISKKSECARETAPSAFPRAERTRSAKVSVSLRILSHGSPTGPQRTTKSGGGTCPGH